MSTLPATTVFDVQTDDFELIREIYTRWDHEYDQISMGRFQGSVTLGHFGTLEISEAVWGKGLRYRGTSPTGSYGMALTLCGDGDGRWLGNDTAIGEVIIQYPGAEAEFLSPNNWKGLVLSIPKTDMESLAADLSGGEDSGVEHLHGVVQPNRHRVDMLRQEAAKFFTALRESYDRTAMFARARQIERLFVASLLESDRIEFRPPSSSAAEGLVRRAEDYAIAHPDSKVGIVELCKVLDASQRTLHYAFLETRGTSPATWLRRMRLNKVHKTLRASTVPAVTVRKIAIENGFFQLGHFSAQYKRLFGQLPSETLAY